MDLQLKENFERQMEDWLSAYQVKVRLNLNETPLKFHSRTDNGPWLEELIYLKNVTITTPDDEEVDIDLDLFDLPEELDKHFLFNCAYLLQDRLYKAKNWSMPERNFTHRYWKIWEKLES